MSIECVSWRFHCFAPSRPEGISSTQSINDPRGTRECILSTENWSRLTTGQSKFLHSSLSLFTNKSLICDFPSQTKCIFHQPLKNRGNFWLAFSVVQPLSRRVLWLNAESVWRSGKKFRCLLLAFTPHTNEEKPLMLGPSLLVRGFHFESVPDFFVEKPSFIFMVTTQVKAHKEMVHGDN